jgi:asparagine synthase (glutamine-hydrolysing)
MGILLSGGMDSCPVGCLAAQLFQQTGQSLTAYSWTLERYPAADESRELGQCAAFAGISAALLPGDELLPFTDPLQEPVGLDSPVHNSYWRLFDTIYRRAAADGCHILLQGTFGDRLYPQGWEVADALSDGQWALAGQELRRQWRLIGWRGLVTARSTRNAVKRLLGVSRLLKPKAPAWLTPEAAARLDFRLLPPESSRHARPDQYQALLGPRLFERSIGHRADQTARGVYRLDPFHDWDLIDYMLAIPAYQTRRLGQTKYLARNAMRERMPEPLRVRPRGSLLSSFFDAGFDRARPEIESFLAQPDSTWPEYLDREALLGTLRDAEASGLRRVLVQMALSYELWRRKIAAEMG